jgi:uncharacterized protein with GYD domain
VRRRLRAGHGRRPVTQCQRAAPASRLPLGYPDLEVPAARRQHTRQLTALSEPGRSRDALARWLRLRVKCVITAKGGRRCRPTSLSPSSPQGISTLKEGPNRLDASKEILNRYGSELKAFYLTIGRYDIVTISEAPDDHAAAKIALTIGNAGNVTTETLRAFTEDEYREIVAALP